MKMSFTEPNRHISTIPFPTVTICPETKVTADKIDWENDVFTYAEPPPLK